MNDYSKEYKKYVDIKSLISLKLTDIERLSNAVKKLKCDVKQLEEEAKGLQPFYELHKEKLEEKFSRKFK
jgi:hypothetical protein